MQNTEDKKTMQEEITFLSKKILELNKKLIESEKAKSRFLSLVTSQLNNPMTVFLGMIPHLKEQDCNKNKIILANVNKEALSLEFKISNLLMAVEIESGNIDVTHALVNVMEIVDEIVESLKYIIEEKNIQIDVTSLIHENIVTDPKLIYIIIKNLVLNACLYGIACGRIDITLSKENSIFTVLVKNQGEGPHVDYMPEMFTRFSETSIDNQGLGIGLSIVRGVCERFDGNVECLVDEGFVTFTATISLDEDSVDSQAIGSNELLFESFEDAIEI